jgi:hypothetical protein
MSLRRFAILVPVVCAAWTGAASAATYDTTTVLTVTPSTANAGEPVTFTATVTGSANPTGSVRFTNGGAVFATALLVPVPGSATASTATYVTSSFAAGTYAITAAYASDDPFEYFASTSAPATLTVSPVVIHNTRLVLSVDPVQLSAGKTATFTAAVTTTDGSPVVPTGDVTFDDNGVLLGTARLDATGTATLSIAGFIAGMHVVTASYAGDAIDRSASSSLTLSVGEAPGAVQTTITAGASPNPIVAGQSATLSAHVVQTGTPTSPPAGELVTFTTSDGVFLGQAPLDAAGNASFTKPGWVTGDYVITASYVGDIDNRPASGTFRLNVLPPRPGPTPTLTVTAPSISTTYGTGPAALAPIYSGFAAGDTPSSLAAPAVCTTTATAASPVGTYRVTCSGAVDPYYAIRYVDGSVSVAPAPLTVTADSVSVVAGQPLPPLTATIGGFVNGETLTTSGVTGNPSCTTAATAASPAGTYPIVCTQGTLAAANYRFASFSAGTLTITAPACTRQGDDDDDDGHRCRVHLYSPSPCAASRAVGCRELTILYAGASPIPVALLSTGQTVAVAVWPVATAHGSYLLSLMLPSPLPPGATLALTVHDAAGGADSFTWHLNSGSKALLEG